MRSSGRGVGIVLVIGLVLGFGFLAFYFKVMVPGTQKKEARGQIQEWADKRWWPLRGCLVGSAPKAAGGRDALLLRAALTTGSLPDAKDCARFFVDLRRPGEASSGDRDIELGWRALESKTAVLANAYLDVDFDRAASIKKVGDAIDAVDAAYGSLRDTAGMDPDPPQGPGPFAAVPAGTMVPHTEELVLARAQTAGPILLGQGIRSDDTTAYMTVRSPTDIRIEGLPSGNVRVASDDAPWAIWLDVSPKGDTTVSIGEVDAALIPVRPGAVLAAARAGVGLVAPVFAFGRGPVRVATYEMNVGAGPALWVVRSLDAGKTFPDKLEVRGDDSGIAFRPSVGQRRFDIFWRNPQGVQWLGLGDDDIAAPLAPRTVFAVPTADPDRLSSCHAGGADWFLLDGAVGRAAAGTIAAIGRVDKVVEPQGCDADHLLLSLPERNELVVCDLQACKTALRARPGPGTRLGAAWGARSGLLAATTSGDLLILWRGSATPEILRMGDAERILHGIIEWNGLVHLLFERVERGLEIVRLP